MDFVGEDTRLACCPGELEPAPATPPTLTVAVANGAVTLTWTDGALQAAGTLDGSFTAVPGATSPLVVQSPGGQQFYRASR